MDNDGSVGGEEYWVAASSRVKAGHNILHAGEEHIRSNDAGDFAVSAQ